MENTNFNQFIEWLKSINPITWVYISAIILGVVMLLVFYYFVVIIYRDNLNAYGAREFMRWERWVKKENEFPEDCIKWISYDVWMSSKSWEAIKQANYDYGKKWIFKRHWVYTSPFKIDVDGNRERKEYASAFDGMDEAVCEWIEHSALDGIKWF